MSPILLAPLLLVAIALLLVLVLRRRAATSAPPVARDSEEVRLLRLQVQTLTEALREARAEQVAPVAPVVEVVEMSEAVETVEAIEEQPTVAPVVELAPEAEPVVEAVPEPGPALAVVPVADEIVRHYTDLSRALAGSGRLREAALAQWAADLRLLAPLLGERTHELHAGLTALAPADAASAVTAARSVAAGLLGSAVSMGDLLPDASHLSATPPAGRTSYSPGDVTAEVLPDPVLRALKAALLDSAGAGGDHARLSAGLRCDLVAHVAPGLSPARSAELVRNILEPHERAAYDARLAG